VSADRDVTRIVRSWLEEGVTTLPDRVLDAVLDQVPATRQRRAWWPARRLPPMNTQIRIVVAAAAVVVLALIGFNLIPRASGVGGPTSRPAPTATTAPSPSPTPGALSVTEGGQALKPGTYTAADPFLVPVTFSLPAGWEGNIGGPYAVFLQQAQGPGAVTFSIFDKVYADPCHVDKGFLDPPPGPSVADLATALASLPGLTATTPTDVTIGGHQGTQLILTAPASATGCTAGFFGVWELPLGATNDMSPGESDRVWILEVGGQRLVIDAPETPGQTAATTAEVQGILDSIMITP
jgi:hypothetical protein